MSITQDKAALVARLLEVKSRSNKTFSEIAVETGLTNAYVAQLFHRQAQLKPASKERLQASVPELSDELIEAMMVPPRRSFHPDIIQDPTIYRMYEAVMHYGESIKAIIDEECGDGIMSGIGFYCNVEKVKGKDGEDRVVVIFNGKFLPHDEQRTENNVARLQMS
eukprot:c48293_g1_i1 orf=44-538(+)